MTHLLKKVRVALTPRSSLLRTQLENGAKIAGYNRSGYGGRGVYIYGDSLEPELRSLQHFLQLGFVFVDVGANVGVYTLKAAKEVGSTGLVIAIEPFLDTACRLSQNVSENQFHNVRLRNLCLGQSTGEAQLYLNKQAPNSFGLFQEGPAESVSVLTASLDDLCSWERIHRLDYLKIDAEGAENLILRGAQNTISRFRPIIQLEITKVNNVTPYGYISFSSKGSPNVVHIPADNDAAIATALKLGWTSQ